MHLRLQATNVTELIDRAIAEVEQHNPPYQVTVYRNYSPEIPRIPMDSELIERVIYNLIMNAVEATAAGGAVTVNVGSLETRWKSP